MEGPTKEQIYEHADKIIGISAEELACEKRWQIGQGLGEITDNVLSHLKETGQLGSIGRIVELEAFLRKQLPQFVGTCYAPTP